MKNDYSILSLCENLAVSPNGYYDWHTRRSSPGPRALEDQALGREIAQIFAHSRKTRRMRELGTKRRKRDVNCEFKRRVFFCIPSVMGYRS